MVSRFRKCVYLQQCDRTVPGPSFEPSGWSFEHKAELITLSIGYSDVLQLFHDWTGTAAYQTQSSVIIGFHEVMLLRKPGIIMITLKITSVIARFQPSTKLYNHKTAIACYCTEALTCGSCVHLAEPQCNSFSNMCRRAQSFSRIQICFWPWQMMCWN